MATRYIIYGLFDPRNGELRYVGKTERELRVRLNHHVHRALKQKTNTHKANWIRALVSAGVRPEIDILEECFDHGSLSEAEQWGIAYWRSLGCRLTNATSGGEGVLGFRHSEEVRLRMSELKKGRVSPRRGTVHRLESKIANSRRHGGRPFRDELGQIYYLHQQAAIARGITRQFVGDLLSGRRKSTSGVCFEYVE